MSLVGSGKNVVGGSISGVVSNGGVVSRVVRNAYRE